MYVHDSWVNVAVHYIALSPVWCGRIDHYARPYAFSLVLSATLLIRRRYCWSVVRCRAASSFAIESLSSTRLMSL